MTHDSPPPRCLIFLVDCSESMRRPVDATQNISWLDAISKAIASDVASQILELEHSHLDFAVIPYRTDRWGEPLLGQQAFPFPALVPSFPARLLDNWAPSAAADFRLPCGGGSPAVAALEHCAQWLVEWTQAHPTSAPPVVVHVTDGVPTDGDPTAAAKKFQSIRTQRGPVLLLHVLCDRDVPAQFNFAVQPPSDDSPALAAVSLWHGASMPLGLYRNETWNPLESLQACGYYCSMDSPALICAPKWDDLTEYLKAVACLLWAIE